MYASPFRSSLPYGHTTGGLGQRVTVCRRRGFVQAHKASSRALSHPSVTAAAACTSQAVNAATQQSCFLILISTCAAHAIPHVGPSQVIIVPWLAERRGLRNNSAVKSLPPPPQMRFRGHYAQAGNSYTVCAWVCVCLLVGFSFKCMEWKLPSLWSLLLGLSQWLPHLMNRLHGYML